MEELYAAPAHLPVLLAARRGKPSNRSQLFLDTQARRGSNKRLYIDVHTTPLSRHVWPQPLGSNSLQPPPSYAHFSPNRRELWQEASPTSPSFSYIRPVHRRKLRPRASVRTRGQRLRRDLSYTLVSAYDAAAAPFRPKQHRFSRQVIAARRVSRVSSFQGAFPRTPPCPDVQPSTTRTVEITGPLGSPDRFDPLGKKLFRQKSIKGALSSPLSLHVPIMPFRTSIDGTVKARASDPPALPRRSAARSRDSFNRAKIHVRRPPKGIRHWFEAIDDSSDDDYPEVLETPQPSSAPAGITTFQTFQPSLGPHRARAAPTSMISQSSEGDYFSYIRANRRRKNSAVDRDVLKNPMRFITEDPNDRSVLDLSSDEESQFQPQSPAGWAPMMTPSPGPHTGTFLRRATMQRKGSAAASTLTPALRQSMASMQTTLTSGTIPFMLRISPGIESGPPPVPILARHAASYLALTGRPPTADGSIARSPSMKHSERMLSSNGSIMSGSHTSGHRSDLAHFVAVTSEEMELLELMRSKKAATQEFNYPFTPPLTGHIEEEEELPVSVPAPASTKHKSVQSLMEETKRSQSLGSTVTLETGENITFPTPPVPSYKSSPRLSASQRGRVGSVPLRLGDLPTPPHTASYWSPEIPTPSHEISELEANPYTGPLPFRMSDTNTHRSFASTINEEHILRPRIFTGAFKTPITESTPIFPNRESSLQPRETLHQPKSPRRTRTYDAADTFNLMPDLNIDFSDFNLLPLSSTNRRSALSPTLDTSTTATFTPSSATFSALSPGLTTATTAATSHLPSTVYCGRASSSASRSPSLTDGGSLSGNSRSELDTPIKEPAGFGPSIVTLPDTHSELEKLAGRKLGVLDDYQSIKTMGFETEAYGREMRKMCADGVGKVGLRRGLDGDGLGEDDEEEQEVKRGGGMGETRKASLEVLDAWRGLGGYEM
ncbi:DNA polymerase alpha-associated DNA helicase A [Sphaceloma murrayae]|uniref:DNA polymerase alpha-associated DNA helicase A n=1 Tax=Sphaceloma murrayae TaxID=2082308 RepID=A0A2K1QNC8_9PEZI|nr:DNA polymerase alpha-associated DNA helicase A [Sphaceloma murrayae]